MLYITDNIKYLRNKQKLSQQEAADGMKLPLDRYKKYEYKNIPPADSLVVISRFYGISIDLLLTVDLSKIEIGNLLTLENNRILLPIMVDKHGENLVEVVTHKAKAGYAAGGYADFKFISELNLISLPWLSKNEKYRIFPIEGDSMPPHNSESLVVGKYVEKLGDVVDGRTYIIITKDKEIVYKRLNKNGKNVFLLISDNDFYNPYPVRFSEIAEIWEYAGSLERGNFRPPININNSLEDVLRELRQDIREIKTKFP
jgi:transcriptional regulator with XRE-family HTH domain